MVPIPAPFPVHRDQQQVRTLERFERGGGVGAPQRMVAERRTQPLQRRRADQEPNLLVGQAVEQLRSKVLAHEPVARGPHGGRPIGCAVLISRRQRREVEAGRPALGCLVELAHLVDRAPPAGGAQERHRFVVVEPQVVALQEHQTIGRHQARDRQPLDRAGRDRDLAAGRQVGREGHDDIERLLAVQAIEVVEHQQERRRGAGDRRSEGRHCRRPDRCADPAGGGDRVSADPDRAVDGHRDVAEEDCRIVIAFVQLEPDRLARGRLRPLGEYGRLAVSGRRGQDDDRHPGPSFEPFDQARSGNEAGPPGRRCQLRLKDGIATGQARPDPPIAVQRDRQSVPRLGTVAASVCSVSAQTSKPTPRVTAPSSPAIRPRRLSRVLILRG